MNKNCLVLAIAFFVIVALIAIFASRCSTTFSSKTFQQLAVGNNDTVKFASLYQKEQKIYYYSLNDSKIKTYSIENKKTKSLLNIEAKNVSNIYYSPDYSKIIIQTYDPYKDIRANLIYALPNQQPTKLDEHIGEIKWNSIGNQIIFRFTDWDRDISQIRLTQDNFSSYKVLGNIDLQFENINLGWLENNLVFYYPIPFEPNKVAIKVINTENLATKTIKKNFFAATSVQNKFLAMDSSDVNNYSLVLADQNGQIIRNYGTIEDFGKIGQDDDTIVFASPTDLGDSINLASVDNENVTVIAESSNSNKLNVSNVLVDNSNRKVYLINSQHFYEINYE